jgi:hypothetical protein
MAGSRPAILRFVVGASLLCGCFAVHCRIVKLVRAIRKGWIKTGKAKRAEQQQPQVYLLWGDDDQVRASCGFV